MIGDRINPAGEIETSLSLSSVAVVAWPVVRVKSPTQAEFFNEG